MILKLPQNAIQLSEAGVAPSDVQLCRMGTFYSDYYGQFSINAQTLSSIVKNYNEKILKIECAIDYAHQNHLQAAGWIKSLSLRNNGTELWASIEWTKPGGECVANKEFCYMSVEFHYDYVDNETGVHYGPTLLGAGLTNRPLIKGMASVVELSETKGDYMNELEQARATIAEQKKQLEAFGTEIAKLSETVKVLSEEKAQVVAAAEAAKVLSEKTSQFEVLLSEGKACEAQRESFIAGDMSQFAKLQQPLNLSAAGHGKEGNGVEVPAPNDSKTPAQDQLIALAEKALSEKRASNMKLALSLVRSENPKLVEEAKLETVY